MIRLARMPNAEGALVIRDATGRLVRRFAGAAEQPDIAWNRADGTGRTVEPGVYFAVLDGEMLKLVIAR
jgi:hypothetical protein